MLLRSLLRSPLCDSPCDLGLFLAPFRGPASRAGRCSTLAIRGFFLKAGVVDSAIAVTLELRQYFGLDSCPFVRRDPRHSREAEIVVRQSSDWCFMPRATE